MAVFGHAVYLLIRRRLQSMRQTHNVLRREDKAEIFDEAVEG